MTRHRLTTLVGMFVLSVAFAGCAGGGGSNAGTGTGTLMPVIPPASATSAPAVSDATRVAAALAASQRADGAIPYTATSVNPYFANIAATGALHAGASSTNARAWIAWYVLHSRDANPWGITGAITDYTILPDGSLQSTGSADAVDAYAATFLTLIATAWRNGDAPTRTYVQSLRTDVERIASAIDAVTDSDGLTWALPSYRFKYLMDQSEVVEGLNDLAVVRSEAYGDASGAIVARQRAAAITATITGTFWNSSRSAFAVAIDANGNPTWPDLTTWADQMTQLAPILHGVIDPSSALAIGVYERFNAAFPAWTALSKPDQYPWASTAFVALQMNDAMRATAYRAAADARYGPSYAYPWYCAESGWYLRALDGIGSPQTIAEL